MKRQAPRLEKEAMTSWLVDAPTARQEQEQQAKAYADKRNQLIYKSCVQEAAMHAATACSCQQASNLPDRRPNAAGITCNCNNELRSTSPAMTLGAEAGE